MIDSDNNTLLIYGDLQDQEETISVRAMDQDYTVSVNGGNEESYDIRNNTTAQFYRNNGDYIMSVTFQGQQKNYQVTTGYAYIIWAGFLICYRTSIYVELYNETTT